MVELAGTFMPSISTRTKAAGTDVRFLDVNIGVVSGIVFDGRGAIARTTDGGDELVNVILRSGTRGRRFPRNERIKHWVCRWLGRQNLAYRKRWSYLD